MKITSSNTYGNYVLIDFYPVEHIQLPILPTFLFVYVFIHLHLICYSLMPLSLFSEWLMSIFSFFFSCIFSFFFLARVQFKTIGNWTSAKHVEIFFLFPPCLSSVSDKDLRVCHLSLMQLKKLAGPAVSFNLFLTIFFLSLFLSFFISLFIYWVQAAICLFRVRKSSGTWKIEADQIYLVDMN